MNIHDVLRKSQMKEDFQKAKTHKYFKRERKGNRWVYYYTEGEYQAAKQRGGEKGYHPAGSAASIKEGYDSKKKKTPKNKMSEKEAVDYVGASLNFVRAGGTATFQDKYDISAAKKAFGSLEVGMGRQIGKYTYEIESISKKGVTITRSKMP